MRCGAMTEVEIVALYIKDIAIICGPYCIMPT